MMDMEINGTALRVKLCGNRSAEALKALLRDGPMTVAMKDYAHMEKFGSLGKQLPRNDERITTEAGDVILSEGHLLVLYYASNTWNFTRLGKVQGLTAPALQKVLGKGDVTAALKLNEQ